MYSYFKNFRFALYVIYIWSVFNLYLLFKSMIFVIFEYKIYKVGKYNRFLWFVPFSNQSVWGTLLHCQEFQSFLNISLIMEIISSPKGSFSYFKNQIGFNLWMKLRLFMHSQSQLGKTQLNPFWRITLSCSGIQYSVISALHARCLIICRKEMLRHIIQWLVVIVETEVY